MAGMNPQMLAGAGAGGPGVTSQDQEKVNIYYSIYCTVFLK